MRRISIRNVISFIVITGVVLVMTTNCKKENQAPICILSTLHEGDAFSVGDSILLSVDVSDEDGSVTEVRYFINGVGLAGVASPPYEYIWMTEEEPAGSYTIRATAYDNENSATNDEVMIALNEFISPPVAGFSGFPLYGEVPLSVSFTDTSLNEPVSWVWDFGDGITSDEPNPEHTYHETGQYTVTLTVSSGETLIDIQTKTAYISVGKTGEPCPGMPTLTDIDGNTYNTVHIGSQCWMKENLKVTHYPNGDEINHIADFSDWSILFNNNTDDAYCYYNNEIIEGYGALYTYAAAIGDGWQRDNTRGQGICPDGWILPGTTDISQLATYLGGSEVAGGKMKVIGTSQWVSPNYGATNESEFSALPAGSRSKNSDFGGEGYGTSWWLKNENFGSGASAFGLDCWSESLNGGHSTTSKSSKSYGLSVRCLKL